MFVWGWLLGYLLGSIPFAYIVTWLKKVDIRTVGSGNPGTTNILRTFGKGWAAFVLVGDMGKGLFAMLLMHLIVPTGQMVLIGTALGAVMGHAWPLFFRFRGGKVVATSAAVLFVLSPVGIGLAALMFFLVLILTRYVSLASMLAGLTVWLYTLVMTSSLVLHEVVTLIFALLLYRHTANMKRLVHGEERKLAK